MSYDGTTLRAFLADMDELVMAIKDVKYRMENEPESSVVAAHLQDACILAADSFMMDHSREDEYGSTTLFSEISSRLHYIAVPKCPHCHCQFEVPEREAVRRAVSGFLTTNQVEGMETSLEDFCASCLVRAMASCA